MKKVLSSLAAVAAFAFCTLAYQRQAAAIPIFYQTGEDIFEAGPLPAPFDKDPKLATAKAGYKCQVFGLFWAYMYWWDCHGVAYQGDSYDNDPKVVSAVEKQYTQASMHMGPWAAYGRFVIVLTAIGAVAAKFLTKKKD